MRRSNPVCKEKGCFVPRSDMRQRMACNDITPTAPCHCEELHLRRSNPVCKGMGCFVPRSDMRQRMACNDITPTAPCHCEELHLRRSNPVCKGMGCFVPRSDMTQRMACSKMLILILCEDTGCFMTIRAAFHRRIHQPALLARERAAWMESASGWKVQGVRRLALQDDPLAAQTWVRNRCNREQRLRVRVARVIEHLFCCSALHNPPQIHHHQPVCKIGNRPQVVGDEQDADPAFALQLPQQIQDFGSDGYVQHRNRFICKQQLWLQRHRRCDHHPLALSTR